MAAAPLARAPCGGVSRGIAAASTGNRPLFVVYIHLNALYRPQRDGAAFLARFGPLFDRHIPKLVPPAPEEGAEEDEPTGEAILHLSGKAGVAICEARSPADAWPGDPARAPLGRVGFWCGAAAAHRY